MGHFAQDCPKPRKNANLARENEQNRKFAKLMDLRDNSVFGYVIYFCGIPIAWRRKGMKSVVLSTIEAEYMALSEEVKELKFIVQLLWTTKHTEVE